MFVFSSHMCFISIIECGIGTVTGRLRNLCIMYIVPATKNLVKNDVFYCRCELLVSSQSQFVFFSLVILKIDGSAGCITTDNKH